MAKSIYYGKYGKLIFKLSLLIISINLMSGCTAFMNRIGYAPIRSPTLKDCETVNVLITNLNKNTDQQQFILPDGRRCPEKYNHE